MAGHPKGLTLRRRELVASLWLRGYSIRYIAEYIRDQAADKFALRGAEKTHFKTVWQDIQACKTDWATRLQANIDTARAEQVARLMDDMHQAWQDFHNKKEKLRPRYLEIVIEIERELAKIMGTLAPTQVTGKDGAELMPRTLRLFMADGTVIKPPHNGHHAEQEVETGGNGHTEP